MSYYVQDIMMSEITKAMEGLKPEYKKWVFDQTNREDYFDGRDIDEVIDDAFMMQQADEYYALENAVENLISEYKLYYRELIKSGVNREDAYEMAWLSQQDDLRHKNEENRRRAEKWVKENFENSDVIIWNNNVLPKTKPNEDNLPF